MTKTMLYVVVLAAASQFGGRSFAQAPAAAPAQAQAIGIFKVAFDEAPGPKDQEFAKPIVFKLRASSSLPDDFHARLFRGSVEALKRRTPDADGCVHFETAVLPVSVRGAVEMRSLDDPSWLHPAGDGFEAQQYTIVFESGDEPAVQVLRIHKTELDGYFQYAVSFNLLPPENLKRAVKETVSKAQAVLQESSMVFQQVTKSVCWSVKPTLSTMDVPPVSAGAVKMAELSPCVNRAEPEAQTQRAAAGHGLRGLRHSRLWHMASALMGGGAKRGGPASRESADAVASAAKTAGEGPGGTSGTSAAGGAL